MLFKKYGWTIQESLFEKTSQYSTFSHTHENLNMFNITSLFNNKLSAR